MSWKKILIIIFVALLVIGVLYALYTKFFAKDDDKETFQPKKGDNKMNQITPQQWNNIGMET